MAGVSVFVLMSTCMCLGGRMRETARHKAVEASGSQSVKVLKGHIKQLDLYCNIIQKPLKSFRPGSNIINNALERAF